MKRIMIASAVCLIGAAALIPAQASARASLPDIEDEVMCPTCGVPLNLAFSPQAERERHFIRAQIAAGKTKTEVKQALVAEFGSSVLALPRKKGFNWAAYLVPIAALVTAALALGLGLVRWRRSSSATATGADIPPADSARLERDLSRYDL